MVERALSRGLLGGLFLIIALTQFVGMWHAGSWILRTHDALSATLWGMFAVLVVIRPVPIHRASSRLGLVVAIGAQSGALLIGAVTDRAGSGASLVIGTILLASGLSFAIASVAFLGTCFGILPDVRGLVTGGPYRVVRHPLYLGELTAMLGIAIASSHWLVAVLLWVATLGLQLARTHFEEQSLGAVFPEYREYAARTKRLIPGLV